MVIKNEKNPKQKIQYFTLKWTQNSESVRKATHKIPACKEHINKSISKLCSFSLAPAKMSALDARHRRERMLMLFIAQGWLPLPLYLRSSQSLTYSCSLRLSQAEDGLPRAVLEALGFALGKWTEICSLFPKHLLQITSSKDNLQQGCSPPGYLCLVPWEPWGCTLLGLTLPPHPTSCGIDLQPMRSITKNQHCKNNSTKPDEI